MDRNRALILLIIVSVAISLLGVFCLPIIDGDSALYASISKHLTLSGNGYELATVNNGPWLDKPHLPFWIQSLFFSIFGIESWVYKLSGWLAMIMSAIYLYRYTREIYDDVAARLSALVFLTSFHIVLSLIDLRAELYQTAFMMASIYYGSIGYRRSSYRYLAVSGIMIGAAAITKGIFVVLVVAISALIYLAITRRFSLLNIPQATVWIAMAAIVLIPELCALEAQFGDSDSLNVNGVAVKSYLSYFFWGSQFGRFLNSGPVKMYSHDYFYFLHTTLWAFLPWVVPALILTIVARPKLKIRFYGLLWGVLLLIFSLSSYQLSHYIVILIPFMSLYLGHEIATRSHEIWPKYRKSLLIAELLLILLMMCIWWYIDSSVYLWIIYVSIASIWLIYSYRSVSTHTLHFRWSIVALLLQLWLVQVLMPFLTKYQSDHRVAQYINSLPTEYHAAIYDINPHLYHFYLDRPVRYHHNPDSLIIPCHAPMLLYTRPNFGEWLDEHSVRYTEIKSYESMSITRLSIDFFRNLSQSKVIERRVLYRIDTIAAANSNIRDINPMGR